MMPLVMVSRRRWRGERNPKQYYPIYTPARYVFLGYTQTQRCHSFEECRSQLALLQMRMGKITIKSQIIYNFLISDEGVVYEARGWRSRACYPNRYEKRFVSRSYYIGFIGNFMEEPPTPTMNAALEDFLFYAMTNDYIRKKFIMITTKIRIPRLMNDAFGG